MNDRKRKRKIAISCVPLILIGVYASYIYFTIFFTSEYANSSQFTSQVERRIEELANSLVDLDLEEVVQETEVSEADIYEYRYRRGSFEQQVKAINRQLDEQIKLVKTEQERQQIEEEKQKKLATINQLFLNEEWVTNKIREERMETFKKEYQGSGVELQQNSDSLPVVYQLENIKTGKVYSSGNIKEQKEALQVHKYNEEKGLLYPITMNWEYDSYAFEDSYSHVVDDYSHVVDDEAALEEKEVLWETKDVSIVSQPYKGTVAIPASAQKLTSYKHDQQIYEIARLFWLTVIGIAAFSLLILLAVRPKVSDFTKSAYGRHFASLSLELQVIFTFALVCINLILFEMIENRYHSLYEFFNFFDLTYLLFFQVVALGVLSIQFIQWLSQIGKGELIARIKTSYTAKLARSLKNIFLNRSILLQTGSFLLVFFLTGFGLAYVLYVHHLDITLFYLFLVVSVALPTLFIFIQRMAYLTRILKQTEQMATGAIQKEIPVEGHSPYAIHAKNINNLRNGLKESWEKQAKSERLKSELITNVSHDLRTPLTSIITYTDLLKNKELTDEEHRRYLAVVEQKSERLKELIEDLFEVSKMTSGNIVLEKQEVDIVQLVQQAYGEMQEQAEKSTLTCRLQLPANPVFIYIDGQRFWRVIDNLLANAMKYAMPNTRVFVTVEQQTHGVLFVVKNISSYELNENAEELVERFKRADASRNTEGSGLGLAIAQSIVELHGGKLQIHIDGDLFKVTVYLPKEIEE